MINQINYQSGVSKTVATYQTQSSPQEAINSLHNAILRCKYKITQQTPTMIKFKTPMSFTSGWGFNVTAIINQNEAGTSVRIEGKSVVPLTLDIYGACKKQISKLEQFL